MLELGLKVFISYLIGSLNGSLIVGWLAGGIDIRKLGSGNPGGTNALRTQGKRFAFWVMLIDIAKGSLPTWILPALAIPFVGHDPEVSQSWLTFACGGAAIVGHCYPVWFGFAGGKGAATAVGVMAVIAPLLLIPIAITWIVVLFISGYVGLATIAGAAAAPVYIALTSLPAKMDLFVFTLLLALFVIYTHRSNIRKIISGDEDADLRFSLMRRMR